MCNIGNTNENIQRISNFWLIVCIVVFHTVQYNKKSLKRVQVEGIFSLIQYRVKYIRHACTGSNYI